MKTGIRILILTFLILIGIYACTNPFAPALTEDLGDAPIITDQVTVEGVFENFRYSYIFKDTTVYGNLLHNDFIFKYTNYDQGKDEWWGRTEDMKATAGLFREAQSIDLIWKEVYTPIGDSLINEVSRGFDLNIYFRESSLSVSGRAKFFLQRDSAHHPWKITQWEDLSF